ncbi:hypothetical protein QTP88_011710 [Uroleucon formosanum]
MRSNSCVVTTSNNSYNNCSVCQDTSHKIYYCPQFLKMTVKSRAEVVKKNKLCFNCLKLECQSFKCTSRACLRCSNKHTTLLHIKNYKTNANKQNNKNEESDSSPQEQENKNTVQSKTTNNSNEAINKSNANCARVIQQPHVLLRTANAHVKDINGKLQEFRALLDNGSQSNFVTQQCISDLGLTATSRITKASGVIALSSCSEAVITLQIMSCTSTFKQNLEFLVLKKIINDLPTSSIPVKRIKLPSGLTLADPEYYKSNKVDMLIGSECFSKLLQRGLIKLGNHRPTLHETALGWVVAGQLNLNYNTQNTASYLCTNSNCQATETINQVITKFWRVEEFKADRLSTDEDIQCEQMYSSTTSRYQYGRYIVKLPLSSDPAVLGDSFQEALRRFRQIEKRLQKDVALQTNYNNFMNEYLSLGHIGANAVEEAKKIISELNSMLAEGGFQLSKWVSNHKSLLNFTTNNKSSNTTDIITVLGLTWNPSNDNLYCTRPPVDSTHAYHTKREVLSIIAKLYDPLGLIGLLVNSIISALKVKQKNIFLWSDSTVTLAWISACQSRWKQFVANRVSEIHKLTPNAQWNHIKSKDNPADLISKGVQPSRLTEASLWWEKLIGHLTTEEFRQATLHCCKLVQEEEFSSDITKLLNNKNLLSKSKVLCLAPFIDQEGVLRVGGRLRHSSFTNDKKHPILLPKQHHITKLIAKYLHVANLHVGPQTLLTIMRQKYWPLSGKNLCKQIVHSCIVCFKAKPKFHSPIIGQLPSARVTPSRPFTSTSINFCGPVYIRQSKNNTQAVHIKKRNFYCDNKKNFVGASRSLTELHEWIIKNKEKIAQICLPYSYEFQKPILNAFNEVDIGFGVWIPDRSPVFKNRPD